MVDEGVIGNTAHTSLTRYAMWAAAVLPSMTTGFADMRATSFSALSFGLSAFTRGLA